MLKWLRKYNTLILVVGGCLLMIAFLLQSVLADIGKTGLFGGTAFKIGSKKVSNEQLAEASRDYNAMCVLVGGSQLLQATFGIESLEHWYMLVREAEQSGLVGGELDGQNFLDELPQYLAAYFAQRDMRYTYDNFLAMAKLQITMASSRAMGDTGLGVIGFHKALAKLRGIDRLTTAYVRTLHYGERRLASQGRDIADTYRAEYVLIPAERELAGIPDPDEAAIKAHYEKYKSTPKGGGEFGIGYTLPPRVKLAWIEINKQIIANAVVVDEIEAEKRFLKKYPSGQAADGKNSADERKAFETQVRAEQAGKALAAAETAVRDEIFRVTRKLDRDGEFYRIPANFEGPDLTKIREEVARRLLDAHKMTIPAPKVTIRSAEWLTADDLPSLEGIGGSFSRRGQRTLGFPDAALSVKEIIGSNDLSLQAGIPAAEPFHDGAGNSYFFVILDARKESTPDSMEEVRADIVRNIKRLAAYEKLKAKESSLLQTAIASGLDPLTKGPEGVPDAKPVTVSNVMFNKTQTSAIDESLDSPAFRTEALAAVASLDPLVDPTTLPNDKKTFSFVADKSLGIAICRVKAIQPLTIEKFRAQNSLWVRNVRREELGRDVENPFSLESMEKRLDVKYEEARQKERAERKAERDAQKSKAAR